LNISANKTIDTVFKVKFIITKNLIPDIEGKAFTSEVEYKIIGMVDDPESSYFYIPFTDVDKLNIKNFSQLKVVTKAKEILPKIRKEIEVLGLKTTSVVDTVKQIESLFGNLRLVLAIVGLVALGVASLGMFNTLTVSLLERIREIGGMKVMGMVSEEVQELFLAEAMIMGLSGGIGGLLLGFLAGKAISLAVSLIAISQGQGYLDLVYLPVLFVIFILIASFVVGVVTGFYPAQRAKRISALNALRYE
jgi:putative ABC transport system permease protein